MGLMLNKIRKKKRERRVVKEGGRNIFLLIVFTEPEIFRL